MIVPDLLRAAAAEAPKRRSVEVSGTGAMTYAEWEARSNQLARALVVQGLEPGDRVALWFTNAAALDYLVGYFAVQKAGGVAVPINPRLAPPEVAFIFDHAEPRFWIGDGDADAVLAQAGVRPRQLDVRAEGQSADPFQVSRAAPDLADVLYTSGTTGFPKGVASRHADVVRIAEGNAGRRFAGAAFLHAFPMHTFAGTHGMLMLSLSGNLTMVVQPRFDALGFIRLVEERRVAITYLAPAMIRLLLERPELEPADLSSIRLILYGSAPAPPEMVERVAKAFPGAAQINVYGLTEAGAASCALPPEEALRRPGSIGRPVPPAELSIRSESGGALAPGEVGEIWLRLPGSQRNYYNDEAATRATWTDDGWLKTGDVGHLDADGYLYIDDRMKDVILRGGHNVYPAEVERVLLAYPGVAEAAVVGAPHRVLGEDVAAFIVAHEPDTLSLDDLAHWCAQRLADYKRPRRVKLVSELPKNAMGKVLRRELRERARE
jgi:acyl-CoA synthetase (AMP-forming)/AMP-acid ligase II